jgi:hypothetical protein
MATLLSVSPVRRGLRGLHVPAIRGTANGVWRVGVTQGLRRSRCCASADLGRKFLDVCRGPVCDGSIRSTASVMIKMRAPRSTACHSTAHELIVSGWLFVAHQRSTERIGTSRCEVPRSTVVGPAGVRTEVCVPERRSQTPRTSLRSARPLRHQTYRSVGRYGHPRNRCLRSSFARLRTADHRQFRPSKGRCWRSPPQARVVHWRCRQTAGGHPAEAHAISRRAPVACRRTG